MHFRKSCLEFEVSAADEVKVLLKAWYQVLARFQPPKELSMRLTEHHLVKISLDDRPGPEELVVLQFLAPQELLDRLLDELGARGLECAIHNVIPGFLTRGRVKKKLD